MADEQQELAEHLVELCLEHRKVEVAYLELYLFVADYVYCVVLFCVESRNRNVSLQLPNCK